MGAAQGIRRGYQGVGTVKSTENEPKIPALTEQQEQDLRRARDMRTITGDPRVRVQVPTGIASEERPAPPSAKRYQIG